MATIKEYLDYAELAQAAYGFLGIGTPNIQEFLVPNVLVGNAYM